MNRLELEHPPSVRTIDNVPEAGVSSESFLSILAFVRRQYLVIAFTAAIPIVLGFIYVLTAPPSYTATASMIIDSRRIQLFNQQSMFSDFPGDGSGVETQVEVLKSENIALAVIKQLHLTEDPEFVGPGGGLIGTLLSAITGSFSSSAPSSDFALTRGAVNTFESKLNIRRVGLTSVILISFRSFSPDRAAQIANAVANAYIDDQLDAKYQAARRAGTWLQERLRELRAQASTAERAVVDFKNKNNMVDAGGRTINEQQLAELNSELVMARSKTAEAQARADRVESILTNNSPEATVNATVSDTLKSDVVSKLRTQYLEMSRRLEDWVPRYGADHLAVVNVRNQMREIQNAIRNEVQRIAETNKSDLKIAEQHENSVQKQLDQAVAESRVTNQAKVGLRELETNAQSYQALYDNFLQHYMESVQQQSFPITDARVISAATRPLGKSNPRTNLVLMLATMVGLAFGAAVGAWRDLMDRVFRTAKQVEALLQTDCIALVPAVKKGAQKDIIKDIIRGLGPESRGTDRGRKNKITGLEGDSKINHLRGESKIADHGRDIQVVKNVRAPDAGQQTIAPAPGIFTMIVDSPFSAFTEAIRSVKVAVDLSPMGTGGKIIGFTSSVPNEGKSSIAAAVARLTAQTGAKTLLVDCDLKNPSLSRALSPRAASGFVDVVKGASTLEKAIWQDPATNMKFLPATMKARLAHSSEILASGQTRKFFDSLRHSYDYIFLDFAPLMPVVDVRASTHLVDGYVYVVEWGKTRTDFVEQALRSSRGVYDHLLGIVLNKVDLRSVGRYDGGGAGYYHHENYYHRYGYTE